VDLDVRYELDPQVALRPEPFGALAYHYGNRRLSFLRSPDIVSVVRSLGDHGSAADALRAAGQASWAETLRQAKDLGEVDIQACSLSMDLLHLEESDLDPLVDGVEGVTAFFIGASDGQIVFI